MGITGLHPFLKKKVPTVFHPVHISTYRGKKVAVDVSGFIYKYKIRNPDKWMDFFVYLILTFRKNLVEPIFIFDGDAPAEKDDEKNRRSDSRAKSVTRIEKLRWDIDEYQSTGLAAPTLEAEMIKLLDPKDITPLGIPINIDILEERYNTLNRQIVKWTESEIDQLTLLFEKAGTRSIISPVEAETYCASLCRDGRVDAVVSNDSDVHVCGAEKLLYEIDGYSGWCTEFTHSEVLEGLKLTHDEFVDFCIMTGCDYNSNMPGIGIMTSFDLIQQYHRIEHLPPSFNTSILRHIRCRQIFSMQIEYEDDIICNEVDLVDLANFLYLRGSKVRMQTLKESLSPLQIEFID